MYFDIASPQWVSVTGNCSSFGVSQLPANGYTIPQNSVALLPLGHYVLIAGSSSNSQANAIPGVFAYGPWFFILEAMEGPCVTPAFSVTRSAQAYCPGSIVTLGCVVTSSPQGTLSFQWWRGSQSNQISGANSQTFVMTSLDAMSQGTYGCTVTNPCGESSIASVVVQQCITDISCNGTVDVTDIFVFLQLWFSRDPRADFNHFNGINVGDIFDFLGSWFSGCS